jgi:ASC-1-like (ASCH) protein
MPLFPAKKEVFAWIKEGKKTIDVRKGKAWRGEVAVVQSGPRYLRLQIVKKETGKLTEIIRADNFRLVIPSAETRDGAFDYLRGLYRVDDGLFTAYYLAHPKQ